MPFPLALIPLAMSGISSISKYITGGKQKKSGEAKLNSVARPDYKIPDGVTENQKTAKAKVYGKSGIEKLLQADAREASNKYATDVSSRATSGAQGLAMMGEAAAQERKGVREAAMVGYEDQLARDEELRNQNVAVSDQEEKAFEYNQREPYLNAQTQGNQEIAAGIQNKASAFSEFTQAAGTGLTNLIMDGTIGGGRKKGTDISTGGVDGSGAKTGKISKKAKTKRTGGGRKNK